MARFDALVQAVRCLSEDHSPKEGVRVLFRFVVRLDSGKDATRSYAGTITHIRQGGKCAYILFDDGDAKRLVLDRASRTRLERAVDAANGKRSAPMY